MTLPPSRGTIALLARLVLVCVFVLPMATPAAVAAPLPSTVAGNQTVGDDEDPPWIPPTPPVPAPYVPGARVDQPTSPLSEEPEPEGTPLAMGLSSSEYHLQVGQLITVTAQVYNRSPRTTYTASLSSQLPAGTLFVANSGDGFVFSHRDGVVTWNPEVAPKATLVGRFQLRVTGAALGDTLPVTVSMQDQAGSSSASVDVDIVGLRGNSVTIMPALGGWLFSEDGRYAIHVPPGAVDRAIHVDVSPKAENAFDLAVRDESDTPVLHFSAPIELIYYYGASERLTKEASLLTFAYRSVAGLTHLSSTRSANWHRLVAAVTDLALSPTLSAATAGEGVTEVTTTDNDGSYEMPPGITGFQSPVYTGAAEYDYPIDVPLAAGGIAPKLSLHYSSKNLDEGRAQENGYNPVYGTYQPWGQGWDLYGASYILGWDNQPATLVLNGVSHSLMPSNVGAPSIEGGARWYSIQDPTLKIIISSTPEDPPVYGTSLDMIDYTYDQNGAVIGEVASSHTFNSGDFAGVRLGIDVQSTDGVLYHFSPAVLRRGGLPPNWWTVRRLR